MKVLLVFPKIEHGATTVEDKGSWTSIVLGYPIITLPHLATITPRKYEVELVNENYEYLNFDTDADLIGITTYTMTSPRVYEIADEFRRRGKMPPIIDTDVCTACGVCVDVCAADVYFGREREVKTKRHLTKMKTLNERRKINQKRSA